MIITALLGFYSYRISKIQLKKYERDSTFLNIESLHQYKSDDHGVDKYTRFVYRTNLGIEKKLKCLRLNDTEAIRELQMRKSSSYLSYFNSVPVLMLNLIQENNSFIVEHANTVIELAVLGELPNILSIKAVIVDYSDGREKLILKGFEDNSINVFGLINNGKLKLHFDEATTSLKNSVCTLSDDIQKKLPDGYSILDNPVKPDFLKYKKMEIIVKIIDIYNNINYNLIVLEYIGGYMRTRTEVIQKRKIKKLLN